MSHLKADIMLQKQRAWERKPRSSSQGRTIWKRYDPRTACDLPEEEPVPTKSPAHVVKKLCLSDVDSVDISNAERRLGVPAQWDRRRSGLRRTFHPVLMIRCCPGSNIQYALLTFLTDKLPQNTRVTDDLELDLQQAILCAAEVDDPYDADPEGPFTRAIYVPRTEVPSVPGELASRDGVAEEDARVYEEEDLCTELDEKLASPQISVLSESEDQAQDTLHEINSQVLSDNPVSSDTFAPSEAPHNEDATASEPVNRISEENELENVIRIPNADVDASAECSPDSRLAVVSEAAKISGNEGSSDFDHLINDEGQVEAESILGSLDDAVCPSRRKEVSNTEWEPPLLLQQEKNFQNDRNFKDQASSERDTTLGNTLDGENTMQHELVTTTTPDLNQRLAVAEDSDEISGSEETKALHFRTDCDMVDTVSGPSDVGGELDPLECVTSSVPFDAEECSTVKVHLNDDTDVLRDFLSRAEASKAARIAKRSSLSNRRDSNAVKQALASPGKVLEGLTMHSPVQVEAHSVVDEALSSPLRMADESNDGLGALDELAVSQTVDRRSTRSRVARDGKGTLIMPNTIAVRRSDGSDLFLIQKNEALELANTTRNNTKRNKGGAMPPRVMLLRLAGAAPEDALPDGSAKSERFVRWNEELVHIFVEKTTSSDFNGEQLQEDCTTCKPMARRPRSSGTLNGTPALRKTNIEQGDQELSETISGVEDGPLKVPEKKIVKVRGIPTPSKSKVVPSRGVGKEGKKDNPTKVEDIIEVKATANQGPGRRSMVPRSRSKKQ